jgi:O-antigen/teichoic acid export membrane protein
MLNKLFAQLTKLVPQKWRWVLSHAGFKRYFSNTGWMFFGQLSSLLVSFFIGAWVARYLGPKNYGLMNYAMSFAGLFGFVAGLGVDNILSREVVKFPDKRDELLGTSFVLKLIGGSLSFILIAVTACLVEQNFLTRLLIIIFGFSFVLQVFGTISIFFQSKVQAKKVIAAQLFAIAVSSILKVTLILLHWGVIWLIIIYVLDALWSGLGLLFAYRQAGLQLSAWRFDAKLAKVMLKDSWPLLLSGAASFIYMKVDQVMIGRMMNHESVGLYAVAIKLSEIWYFIPSVICTSLAPALINARRDNQQNYRYRLRSLYLLLGGLALAIAIVVSLIAKPLIIVLFGSAYVLSVPILQIYVWSGLGIFVGSAVTQYLVIENMVKTVFVTSVLAMLSNVGLNLILIPRVGLSGAALASLISYIATPVLILLFDGLLRRRQSS